MTVRAGFIPEDSIALFLDVDRTLLEIADSPESVRVPAALRNTLELALTRERGARTRAVCGVCDRQTDHSRFIAA